MTGGAGTGVVGDDGEGEALLWSGLVDPGRMWLFALWLIAVLLGIPMSPSWMVVSVVIASGVVGARV